MIFKTIVYLKASCKTVMLVTL